MKFLIVTPNFNSGKYLASTFTRMLEAKKCCNKKHEVNWIIMDACSRDQSIHILRYLISSYGFYNLRHNLKLNIQVEIAKDKGMYEGINNGLMYAKEKSIDYDCFFWLNSDDQVCLKSFDSIEQAFNRAANKNALIIGRGIDIDEASQVILDKPHPKILFEKVVSGDFNYTSGEWIKAESCVFPRDLVEKVGLFNQDLRLAGDYEYIVRCSKIAEPEYDDECYAREFRRCQGQQSSDLRPYEIERRKALEIVGSQRQLTSENSPKIGTIYFYPDYTSGNSYQESLYEGKISKGFTTAEDLLSKCPKIEPKDVLHIHWLNDIIRRDPEVAKDLMKKFEHFLLESKKAGALIVWTIHNIHSHESRNSKLERDAYEFLIKHCDRCHMHDVLVVYEFNEYYKTLPWGRIRIAEHGAYAKALGPQSKSILAEFGICEGDKYIVVPGQLRKYKNLPLLRKALEYIGKNYPDVGICLLGRPHPELKQKEVESIYSLSNVFHSRSRLNDDDYSRLVRDSLFSLLTYVNISTSGSAIHSLSQGTKIIAPRLGTLQTCVTNVEYGYLYSNDNLDSLYEAIDMMFAEGLDGNSKQEVSTDRLAQWSTMLPRILA
jgi:glycosyltransferase involved in cell wall biosynthesis